MQRIGSLKKNVVLSDELKKLAEDDARTANICAASGSYRIACYLLIQAMEKEIRSRIFALINPQLKYFREKSRTHSLDSAIELLIEMKSAGDSLKRDHITSLVKEHILGGVKYNQLHNNLRYPFYSEKSLMYFALEASFDDYKVLSEKLRSLKSFLKDLHLV